MAAARAGEFGHSVKGGIVAGIIGGIAISVWMLISTLVQGMDPWMIFKGAGAPFLGERAMQPGFDGVAVLVGTLCHFGISIVWGALFGVLFYGLSRAATVAMGVVWGVVVWLAMYYLVLPLVGLGAITESVPPWKAAVEHVLFGVVVALGFLPFQRRVTRHVPRPLAPTRPTPTTPAT